MPVGAWDGLEPSTIAQLSEELLRIEARVKAQQLAAARALDASGFAKSQGASSTGAMLAGSFGGDKRAGDQMVFMGKAARLRSRTEEALARGEIGPSQAAIIASAIGDLPDDTTDSQREACEDTLIGDADRFNLRDLRSRSKRITDQFKPEPEVDKIENQILERQEKDAWRRSEFWMVDNGDGTCRGGFRHPGRPSRHADGRDPGHQRTQAATTSTTTPLLRSPTTTATWNTGTGSAWDSPNCAGTCPVTSSPAKADSVPP